MVYMQSGEVLSTYEVKYTKSWEFFIAPSGRNSLMKYLNMMSNGNMLYYNHPHDSEGKIKRKLENKFKPKDDSLDGKVYVPLVLKCLGLTIGLLLFEDPMNPSSQI